MSAPVVVGVDPGGRETGIVTRVGDHLLAGCVIVRDEPGPLASRPYLDDVMAGIMGYRQAHGAGIIAVEAITAPKGFDAAGERHPINPEALIALSMVLGGILTMFPDALLVPPIDNGGAPLTGYPPQLVGPRETKGTGRRRHLRSAWDVAGLAPRIAARNARPLRAV